MQGNQPLVVPKVLFSQEVIAARVQALGQQINDDYRGRSLVVLAILKGSFMFAADLIRCIDVPLRVEFLGLASYGVGSESTGVVQITQDLTSSIVDENLLVVEDIVDSGLTLSYLLRLLETRKPRSVRVCSLLHKPARTKQEVPIHYLGFTIPDEFVVGYGLDYAQSYRNLPYLGMLDVE